MNAARYMLTIVDDCTKGLWIYLLGQKSDVCIMIKGFLNMIKTQFGVTVKVIQTNNGVEFLKRDCRTLFLDIRIIHQHSCLHIPQQNGLLKRKHKHLLKVARALLF